MTDNTTPKRPNYSRPTKYPAALPRTMTTTEQRERVDEIREKTGHTLGEIVRALLDDGLTLLGVPTTTREDVQRIARDSGVDESEALATMLDFAVRESRRRLERNARIAHEIGAGLGEMGFMVDGVTVGGIDLEARL